jgi:hypothetical protein
VKEDRQSLFILTPDATDSDGNGVPDACEAIPDATSEVEASSCGAGLAPAALLTLAVMGWARFAGQRKRRII